MAGMTASGDFDPGETFYEEDRPLEEVLAAFERGVKGVTARPQRVELSGAAMTAIQELWRAQDFRCPRCHHTILPSDLHQAILHRGKIYHPECRRFWWHRKGAK